MLRLTLYTNFKYSGAIRSNLLQKSLILFFVLLISNSCKKEIQKSQVETDTFFHAFPTPANENSFYLKSTDDNGFMLFYNESLDSSVVGDMNKLCIQKINAKGETEWVKKILSDKIPSPLFAEQADGSILFTPQGEGKFGKISKNGDLVFVSTFWTSGPSVGNNNSYPLVINDTFALVAFCDGLSRGTPSNNQIQYFDRIGVFSGTANITDAEMGFKTLYFSFYDGEIVGDYVSLKVYGWCFTNWIGDWGSPIRLFYGKIILGAKKKLLYKDIRVIDPKNNSKRNAQLYQLYTSKKELILVATQSDLNTVNQGMIIKIDDKMNIVFQKDIIISPDGTNLNGMSECPDGNYLAFGYCNIPGKSTAQPFVCKISTQGDLMWQKIFSIPSSGYINWAIQKEDGTCFLTGVTNGFSQGKNQNDIILIKTDKSGNLK